MGLTDCRAPAAATEADSDKEKHHENNEDHQEGVAHLKVVQARVVGVFVNE